MCVSESFRNELELRVIVLCSIKLTAVHCLVAFWHKCHLNYYHTMSLLLFTCEDVLHFAPYACLYSICNTRVELLAGVYLLVSIVTPFVAFVITP